jgi:hypothetical protein
MAIKTIPLSRLKMDLEKTLDECASSGQALVVEMPDQRLLAIQSLDPNEDDSLKDKLLATNPAWPRVPRSRRCWRRSESARRRLEPASPRPRSSPTVTRIAYERRRLSGRLCGLEIHL